MLRMNLVAVLALSLAVQSSAAQRGFPISVAAAEAEGAAFPRGAKPVNVPAVFSMPFAGSAERKCVTPRADDDDTPQLRSGDFIVRGRFVGEWGPHAKRANKFWWAPTHNPFEFPNALLLRATRLGHPDDAFRLAIADWAYPRRGYERESGFPSGVGFPKAGNWIVIATSGDDWGCFLISVGPEIR
jgi:hypothetical protein